MTEEEIKELSKTVTEESREWFEKQNRACCEKCRDAFKMVFPEILLAEKGEKTEISLELREEDSSGFANVLGSCECEDYDYLSKTGGMLTEMLFLRERIDGLIEEFDKIAEKDEENETAESIDFLRKKITVGQMAKDGAWLASFGAKNNVCRVSSWCFAHNDADAVLGCLELLRRLSNRMKVLDTRWEGFSLMGALEFFGPEEEVAEA